ncbi:Protein kinase and PP2C-like domain-containing protein [Camellia lanceoleosa]|uniref:Protein kinase and PP2C-like domain-containing protein n=1 Tax=Camellia lanceoleosa TaxID=1840588 RepID=A0ACC0GL79_9ERIC|nr:Protein kinase and PP2C-like domain-containing protein [Camellia lanceoleosa]
MEDTHFLMPHMCGEKDVHVFGIFDGHRGAAAAEFSARALPGFLQSLGSKKSPSDALLEAFVKTNVAFRNELDSHRKSKGVIQKDWHPGCTAIVALIVRNKLFVANAGDCRAMLCRAGSAYALSKDHVASCPEERERIISEGGQVTRSIGDDDMKPVVTAEPEITETILFVEDEYLVMASNGSGML